jgi:hypothetical protein
MLHKKSLIFTPQNWKNMQMKLYILRYVIAFAAAIILLFSSCKKSVTEPLSPDLLQQYFEANILNSDFYVDLATDNGTNLTTQYNGYLFKLLKNTLLDGPMTATKNGVVYTGTWACNDDYSKLVITLPNSPAEFQFLNREWKFTKKSTTLMELAPWGVIDAKVLNMKKQ